MLCAYRGFGKRGLQTVMPQHGLCLATEQPLYSRLHSLDLRLREIVYPLRRSGVAVHFNHKGVGFSFSKPTRYVYFRKIRGTIRL